VLIASCIAGEGEDSEGTAGVMIEGAMARVKGLADLQLEAWAASVGSTVVSLSLSTPHIYWRCGTAPMGNTVVCIFLFPPTPHPLGAAREGCERHWVVQYWHQLTPLPSDHPARAVLQASDAKGRGMALKEKEAALAERDTARGEVLDSTKHGAACNFGL
jgi:hypothetical protein